MYKVPGITVKNNIRGIFKYALAAFLLMTIMPGSGLTEQAWTEPVLVAHGSSLPIPFPLLGDISLVQGNAGEYRLAFMAGHHMDSLIYLSESKTGKSWRKPKQMMPRGDENTGAWLLQDNGGAWHLVWSRHRVRPVRASGDKPKAVFDGAADLWHMRSKDGTDWQKPRRIPVSSNEKDDRGPTLALRKDGNIHLAWASGQPGIVMQSYYKDKKGWQEPTRIGRIQGKNPGPGLVSTAAGKLLLVYVQPSGLFLSESENSWNWSEPKMIMPAFTSQLRPRLISGAGGNYRLAFQSFRSVWLSDSDNLENWSKPENFQMTGRDDAVINKARQPIQTQSPAIIIDDTGRLCLAVAAKDGDYWGIYFLRTVEPVI
jgi:hypothetical protein